MFRILFYLATVAIRLGVAFAPFYFMSKGHDLSFEHFALSLIWFPLVVGLLFRPSEFEFRPKARRRVNSELRNRSGLTLNPMHDDYLRNM